MESFSVTKKSNVKCRLVGNQALSRVMSLNSKVSWMNWPLAPKGLFGLRRPKI
jgi:hypothetical protein